MVINEVAKAYIYSNGLQTLENFQEKLKVARSVFKELDKATSQPGVPFFPELEDLKGPREW